MSHARPRMGLWLVLLGCLEGCTPKVRPGASSETSATAPPAGALASPPRTLPSASPAAPSSALPAAPASAPDRGEWIAGVVRRDAGRGTVATLNAVRFAKHEGFDRVVFEFDGNGLPARHIEYVDRPVRQCGSGDPTELLGDGWLSVSFEPARAHTDAGAGTLPFRETRTDLPVIREIELTCDFEAHVTAVFGVARPNRYRLLELSAPPRLVVDIRH